ncbi:MAG TPA: ATP-dependent DNA helicase [Candidatus Limnocylindrales bacterium]|nr:ATP-dependent DNA helicase [Candidatus Limnocylindrales bacterium]
MPQTPPLLAGLDRAQRCAVTHGDGPLLVVAGAGTGKTHVITRRVAWLIATRRARPTEILALTFTERAAAEMQARVDTLVPYGYVDTAISTFHAFGDRLVREFGLELGLGGESRVLSRAETVVFLHEHLFELGLERYRPLSDPTRFLGAFANLVSRCKDEGVSVADYEAYAARLREAAKAAGSTGTPDAAPADLAERQSELARAYGRYQDLMQAKGLLDFGDQVSLARRLLRDHPAVRSEVQRRYRYVLVDEFQDTNTVQAELVAVLVEQHRNLTVVGDDDQSIYAFRGAALDNILGFRERYPEARIVVLKRNHRSLTPILAAGRRLIRHNDPDRLESRAGFDKQLVATRRSVRPASVRHVAFPTASDEADWIADQVGQALAAGRRPREMAVLVRTNALADPILRSLSMRAVPWRFSGAAGLFARPEIRLLAAFLRAVADPHSSVDLFALASSDRYGLAGNDLMALMAYARRRHRSLWETVLEIEDQPGIVRLEPASAAAVAHLRRDIRTYGEMAQQRSTGEVLYAFLSGSGWLRDLAAAKDERAEEALVAIARFFEIVRRQSAHLADDRLPFFVRHLRTLTAAGDDTAAAPTDPNDDAVQVLTVHQAKGLEFGIVFLAGLAEGIFPSTSRRDALSLPDELGRRPVVPREPSALHLAEERRLFYVAMTRARDELVLTHAADYGGRRARRVSPFVLEALDRPAVANSLDRSGLLERLAGFAAVEPAPETARAHRTPPSADGRSSGAAPNGHLDLSFYQVDDYLTCPLKYRYVHGLRVPLQAHHSIVYGAALHRAIQEFHRRQQKGETMSEAALIAAFEAAWTGEGFLTREHEEARLEAGRAALRRFRTEQLAPGAVVPTHVEEDFAFVLDDIRVRGRWDRVDVEATEPAGGDAARVTITDYKSSDVREPARARARAKESLQLAIYALGWEARDGRLPDALQLHFLESGVVGRVTPEPRRLEEAREGIRRTAAGLREGRFEPTPHPVACGYCPFREICPASRAR